MSQKRSNKTETAEELFSSLAAPAGRALENAGIKTLEQLSGKNETGILKLHRMGPSTIPKLRSLLKLRGLSFIK
jgi:hypothetical protein